MPKIVGGCQCGAVRYEINADPIFAGHCQCTDCRKATGAGHITVAAFPEGAVKFAGKSKSYGSKSDTGANVTRDFCSECGGRTSSRASSMPGLIMVTAGSMDDPSLVSPGMALYNKRHVAWDYLNSAIPTFDGMPLPAGK